MKDYIEELYFNFELLRIAAKVQVSLEIQDMGELVYIGNDFSKNCIVISKGLLTILNDVNLVCGCIAHELAHWSLEHVGKISSSIEEALESEYIADAAACFILDTARFNPRILADALYKISAISGSIDDDLHPPIQMRIDRIFKVIDNMRNIERNV